MNLQQIKIEIPCIGFPEEPSVVIFIYKDRKWLFFDGENNTTSQFSGEDLIQSLVFYDLTYIDFVEKLKKSINLAGYSSDILKSFPFEDVIIYALRGGREITGEGYSYAAIDWLGLNKISITKNIKEELLKLLEMSKDKRFNITHKVRKVLAL